MTTEISYVIDPASVEWEMDWTDVDEDGNRRYPDKPDKEMRYEWSGILALLLNNEVIHLNSYHWKTEWPEEARKSTCLGVICSDVFSWGCADSEDISCGELKDLYLMYKDNPSWGPTIWCMIKRREMPQGPVAKLMREAGVDVDSLHTAHGLRLNFYDGVSAGIAKLKYYLYSAWAAENGHEVLPFDKHWWAGWNDYAKANPDWHRNHNDEMDEVREQFKKQNGFY